ncbi:CrcB family protein [Bifidobacterium sp. ESL0763]|uniref:fluoride efflux transporter FluC n=1 Tax=Bifidobacterium sp. ESL0763 TaxID=2983227 RepID=UPI0023F7F591|nr:CrcB family protein [Bifidobacterium sp. ESL0763]MDF7664211.1 CrcB family protein [Bifidobacterium sp. ESL0763]
MKSESRTGLTLAALLLLAGACGSLVRLSLGALQPSDAAWPWMTMAINLTGAALLGCLTAYMAALGPDVGRWRTVRLALGTGLIGGYTTYSTFMLEAAQRLLAGSTGVAVGYLAASIVPGTLCALLGLALGGKLGRWRAGRVVAAFPGDSGRSSSAQERSPDHRPLLRVAVPLVAVVAVIALAADAGHWRGQAVALLLLASLCGGCGAFLRYLVDARVNARVRLPLPCGTIVVNVTACLLMGLVAGWCGAHAGMETPRYLLASGLLGGYSTFSTASLESARLAAKRRPALLVAHTLGMAVAGLAAVMAGLLVWH